MSLTHAAVNSSATTYPSVISVTCQSGYVLNERTDNEARCAHTGDWVLVGDDDVALEDCSRKGCSVFCQQSSVVCRNRITQDFLSFYFVEIL